MTIVLAKGGQGDSTAIDHADRSPAVIVSDARREANRKNAEKSTGPRTEAGKAVACRNSTRHGLTAVQGVALGAAEVAEVEGRAGALAARFGPRDEWEGWLVEQLAGTTLRLDRLARREARAREVAAWRAGELDLWDEDRRHEAEEVAARLAHAPARTVAALRRTPHGCDWLIGRWEALARRVEGMGALGGWDEAEKQLAHDLLGTPEASRTGPLGLLPPGGDGRGPAPRPLDLARARIAELHALRARVAEADAEARAAVELGLAEVPSAEVATLRRYERATLRHLGRLADQMKAASLAPARLAVPPEPAPLDPAPRQLPDVPPPLATPTADVPPERIERNEPITGTPGDESNPSPDHGAAGPPRPQVEIEPSAAPRPRPDRPEPARAGAETLAPA